MKQFSALVITTLFLVVGFFYWAESQKLRFNYPSQNIYLHFGLDVSHHQGEIDWEKVDDKKYSFVYIKATEGGDFVDSKFERNFTLASQTKLFVGGYHFWSFCRPKEDQLQNILQNIPAQPGSLVPALDVESFKTCEDAPKIEDRLVDDIEYANKEILKHYGTLPLIYTTIEFTSRYPALLNFQNKFWLRSLMGSPTVHYNKPWLIWQYYNAGKVEGIKGPADLNVLNGGMKTLEELVLY